MFKRFLLSTENYFRRKELATRKTLSHPSLDHLPMFGKRKNDYILLYLSYFLGVCSLGYSVVGIRHLTKLPE